MELDWNDKSSSLIRNLKVGRCVPEVRLLIYKSVSPASIKTGNTYRAMRLLGARPCLALTDREIIMRGPKREKRKPLLRSKTPKHPRRAMIDEREHRRRAIAHLKSAVRYERKGLCAKARAHFGRAMHYGFGTELGKLPNELIEMIVRYVMEGSTEMSASWLAFPIKVDVPEFLRMSAEEMRKHIFYPFYIRTVHATARKGTRELLEAYRRLPKRSDINSIAGALTNLHIMIVEYWYHMCPYRFHELVALLHAKGKPIIIKELCGKLLDTFMSHLDSTEECAECMILKRPEIKMQIQQIINKNFEPRAIDVDGDGKVVEGFVKKYENKLDEQKTIYGHLCVWKTGGLKNMIQIFDSVQWKDEEWDVRLWDTRLVHDMSYAFLNCKGLLSGVECWGVSEVRNMRSMFSTASEFNRDISSWDTRSAEDMSWMFYGATSFNQDIGNWDTSKAVDMSFMFYRASMFNRDIGKWNTSKVGSMRDMFGYAASFNQPIGIWSTSNVRDMSMMFLHATAFNQDISRWDMSNVETRYLAKMFEGATAMESKNKPVAIQQ